MAKFKIGDKVVCIETDQQECDSNGIVHGMTYVVEHIDEYGPEEEWLLYFGDTSAFAKRFKLAEEQVLSNAFNKVVKEVGETFVAKSLIEKETEMTAEQIRDEILRIDVRIEEAKKDIENAEKERNSLVEKLQGKGFELLSKDIKIGDTVRVIGNIACHGFKIGCDVEITDIPQEYGYFCKDSRDSKGIEYYVRKSDVKKI